MSCANCGKDIIGRKGNAKFCSDRCRDQAKWRRQKQANPCPGCGRPMARSSATSASDQRCRECRFPLPAHGQLTRYAKHGCRCAKCKAAQSAEARRYREQRKAEGRPLHAVRAREWRGCECCGIAFRGRVDSGQRFCSVRCAKQFQGWDGTTKDRWRPSPSLRAELLSRDSWTCQLCHSPVRDDVPVSHPRYPNLDHILPRSKGGSDDAANLRVACRQCNVLRGANTEWAPSEVNGAVAS